MIAVAAEATAWLPLVAIAGVLSAMLGLDRERVLVLLPQVLLVVASVLLLLRLAGQTWTDPQVETDVSQPALAGPVENAFPSDHVALPLSLTLLAATVRRRTGVVFAGLVLLGGLARLLAGSDRWPDVAAGCLIAAIGTFGVLAVWRRLRWVAWLTRGPRPASASPAAARQE